MSDRYRIVACLDGSDVRRNTAPRRKLIPRSISLARPCPQGIALVHKASLLSTRPRSLWDSQSGLPRASSSGASSSINTRCFCFFQVEMLRRVEGIVCCPREPSVSSTQFRAAAGYRRRLVVVDRAQYLAASDAVAHIFPLQRFSVATPFEKGSCVPEGWENIEIASKQVGLRIAKQPLLSVLSWGEGPAPVRSRAAHPI